MVKIAFWSVLVQVREGSYMKFDNEEHFRLMLEEEDDYKRELLRNDIVKNNMKMVHYCINKKYGASLPVLCAKHRITREDFESHAIFGLVKAVDTFDLEKGFKFATYAFMVVYNELAMYVRKFKQDKVTTSLDANMDDKDGRDMPMMDTLVYHNYREKDTGEEEFLSWFYEVYIHSLGDRDKIICKLLIIENKHQAYVSQVLGVSQSYISRLFVGICNKAKTEYQKYLSGVEPDKVSNKGINESWVISSYLPTLKGRDFNIISLRYIDKLNLTQIGKEVGYSQVHVSRLIRNINKDILEKQPKA